MLYSFSFFVVLYVLRTFKIGVQENEISDQLKQNSLETEDSRSNARKGARSGSI